MPFDSTRGTTDLSQMTPREQADRLYDRVARASESGDSQQVQFFGPMALQAYTMLSGTPDADARLHIGLIQLALNDPAGASAQGDTILRASRTHLYGFLLRARAGDVQGNAPAARQAYQSFVSNYDAERAQLSVTRNGRPICAPSPERRFYPAGGQSTSEVGICYQGLSHVYVVLGERGRTTAGAPAWNVRVWWNPWARLIFLGPAIMALGGLVSLLDRRLRLGTSARGTAT